MNSYLANDVLLVSKNTIRLWEGIMAKKFGDKSWQSNSDKWASDFGSFLVIGLLL